jgi:hypothetical protein
VLVRVLAFQPDLVPVDRVGGFGTKGHEARRFGVVQVRDDEHRCRVLHETVRHLFEPEADVLEADLLRHHHERHGRKQRMRMSHQAREHGRVSHAGVEQPERGLRRADATKLFSSPIRDRRLLVAGVDESEILLAVVVKTKRCRPRLGLRPRCAGVTRFH